MVIGSWPPCMAVSSSNQGDLEITYNTCANDVMGVYTVLITGTDDDTINSGVTKACTDTFDFTIIPINHVPYFDPVNVDHSINNCQSDTITISSADDVDTSDTLTITFFESDGVTALDSSWVASTTDTTVTFSICDNVVSVPATYDILIRVTDDSRVLFDFNGSSDDKSFDEIITITMNGYNSQVTWDTT